MSLQVAASEAAAYYKVTEACVRKWAREGKIPTNKTPGGHYKYILPSPLVDHPLPGEWSQCVVYARVSSRKQSDDLDRQAIYLQDLYPSYTLVKDVGSGINFKRKGFLAILERVFSGVVKTVVVAHQDRWSRFGFEFFEWLFKEFGATLQSVDKSGNDPEEDITADIMEIFTVFTARYYGSRKYRKVDTNDEDAHISDKEAEATFQ
jgi:putative resolvase